MRVFALLMVGCGVRLPDPAVTSVEPNRGWVGEETVISIEGENFYPEVQIDLNRRGIADLDRGFSAWLQSEDAQRIALSAVGVVDYEHLSAVVPPGLDLGQYALIVEGPSGRAGELADAFTALPTRADSIALTPVRTALTIGEEALIEIALVDPDNERVFQDLEVEVRARGLTGPVRIGFGDGLENEVTSPDGLVLTGFLGGDGRASLSLALLEPTTGIVELTVDPVDPTSPLRSGLVTLTWAPGAIDHIEFELPATSTPPFAVDAGTTFLVDVIPVDASGNVIPDADETVLIETACGDWIANVQLQGPTTIDVTPTRATDFDNCDAEFLRVVLAPGQRSEAFEVRAGPAASLDVSVAGDPQVGVPFNALVSPRDAWGNRTAWAGDLLLDDTLGGVRDASCERRAFSFDDQYCVAISTVSGSGVQLVATSAALSGISDPYDVSPGGDVAALHVEPLVPVAVAGQPTPVAVRLIDAFGNTIPFGPGAPVLGLTDEIGQAACDDTAPLPDGRAGFACALLTARSGASMRASLGSLIASSSLFDVVNGELALAVLDAPPTAVAGAPFLVGVELTDAWGNPYVAQSVTSFELGAVGAPRVVVPIAPDGSAEGEVTVFHAGSAVISAWSGADEIGVPTQVFVEAGPTIRYLVEPVSPWGWVGAPTEIRVTAVDAWDNRTNDASTVSVGSASGDVGPVDVSLVNGAVTVPLTWSEPALDEEVEVVGAGLDGTSEPFHVVEDCGVTGPVAGVAFAGAPTGRACLEPDEPSASVAISFADSQAGVAPLAVRAVSVDGQAPTESTSGAFSFEVTRIGRSDVQALIVDAAGCGAAIGTEVWAGPDDGGVVGVLPWAIDAASLTVGVDATEIRVEGAVDCTGDPAAGATLAARADRGALDAVATGAGLVMVLDGSGSGAVLLDASAATTGGTGHVWLEAPSGGAAAAVPVTLTGDDRPPTVWSQTPSGAVSGEVDVVVLQFDEPLLALTVLPSGFSVGGTGSVGVSAVTVLDPTRLEVVLDAPVDASSGWILQVEDSLRDQAGNLLHGGLDGAPGPWVGPFGGGSVSVPGASCALDTPRFRPDGDPGVGEEADEVWLDMASSTTPASWVVSVRDGGGVLIARERLAAVGPTGMWAWDGRDVGERVVPNGSYTLSVEPDDGLGNRGAACVGVVVVDNGVGP